MTIDEFRQLFPDAESTHHEIWMYKACCPCGYNHKNGDKHKSFYFGVIDNHIVVKCHTGCTTQEILDSLHLTKADLYNKAAQDQDSKRRKYLEWYAASNNLKLGAIYNYCYGRYNDTLHKVRFIDSSGNKTFRWMHDDNNTKSGFKMSRIGERRLYARGIIDEDITILCEGEKDANSVYELMNMAAVSAEDGAEKGNIENKWRKEYTRQLRNKTVYVLQDNDETGQAFAKKVCEALTGNATAVYLLDLTKVWQECPDKGDITDMIEALGKDEAKRQLEALMENAEKYRPEIKVVSITGNCDSDNINVDGSGLLTIANFEAFLQREKYEIKLNEITHKYEFSGFGAETSNTAALAENAPEIMRDKLQKELKKADIAHICSLTGLHACNNTVNPILDLINSQEWDKTDRITELFTVLHIKEDIYKSALRKWLYQCYCGLHNDIVNSFSLDSVLVLRGRQGLGKTRFFEALALKRQYFAEGITLDVTDKDSIIGAVSTWITELGEIGSTMRLKDENRLKAFISKAVDRFRPPYGRTTVEYPRRTSFCGSTNDEQFLTDETGSRRYIVIALDDDVKIDVKQWLPNFNMLQLWAQVQHEVEQEIQQGKTYANVFRIPEGELKQLADKNQQYQTPIKGENAVREVLHKLDEFEAVPMTTAEFIQQNSELSKYTPEQIGRVLRKLGYTNKVVRAGLSTARVYWLPKVKFDRIQ